MVALFQRDALHRFGLAADGHEPAAIAFTQAQMDDSRLFFWVKVLEIVLGLTILATRFLPLTLVALTPINIVIVYWNFVLDPARSITCLAG